MYAYADDVGGSACDPIEASAPVRDSGRGVESDTVGRDQRGRDHREYAVERLALVHPALDGGRVGQLLDFAGRDLAQQKAAAPCVDDDLVEHRAAVGDLPDPVADLEALRALGPVGGPIPVVRLEVSPQVAQSIDCRLQIDR